MFDSYDNNRVTLADVDAIMMQACACGEPRIDAAIHHHFQGGGRVRALLGLDAAQRLGLDHSTAKSISAASELLHNASLVHDDLQDKDKTRRGREAVWSKYGSDTAICVGDLMISAASCVLAGAAADRVPALILHLHRRTVDTIAGQSSDLAARGRDIDLSTYRGIASGKSAPLLALPLELCYIAAGRSEAVELVARASCAFALAYQMADDIDDADQDRETGEANIVATLGHGADTDEAIKNAVRLAADAYRDAAARARHLPHGVGETMAALADERYGALIQGRAL